MRYNNPPKDEFDAVMSEAMRKMVAEAYIKNKKDMEVACCASKTEGLIEMYKRLYDFSEYERIKSLMHELDSAFTRALCNSIA